MVDEEAFKELIYEEVNRRKNSSIQEDLQNLYMKSENDLQYPFNRYVEDTFDLLKNSENSLVNILNSESLIFYISELIRIDSDN